MAFTTADLTPSELRAQLKAAGLSAADAASIIAFLNPGADGLIPVETATTAGNPVPELLAPDGDRPQVLDLQSAVNTVNLDAVETFPDLRAIVQSGDHADLTVNSNNVSADVWAGGGNGNVVTVQENLGTLHGGSGVNQKLTLFATDIGTLIEGSGNHQTATLHGAIVAATGYGGSGERDVLNGIGEHLSLIGGTGNNQHYSLEGQADTLAVGSGNNDVANVGGQFVTATGGSGNNDVLNVSAAVSSTISEGSGNNQVINASDSIGCTFHGGSGHNDKLNIAPGHSVIADGGGANQHILASGGSDTLNLTPGKHETVDLASSGHNIVNVAASSGNVTISGATSTDTINIAEGAHVHVVGVDPIIHYV